MYDQLPNKLKSRDDFCNCKFEVRNGRPSKVPYMVNGKRANPTDQRCFTSFDAVCANLTSCDGIGVGIFDDLVAIDIDHCVVDGVPSEMAQDIIDTMDCYTEYSPSGNGIRMICTASNLSYDKAKYYINNRKLGLEVYVAGATNKYLTITGNVICDKPPQYRDAELTQVVNKYMKRSTTEKKNEVVAPGSFLSDESVIQKILVDHKLIR
jgi:putative DNA primase/helicase